MCDVITDYVSCGVMDLPVPLWCRGPAVRYCVPEFRHSILKRIASFFFFDDLTSS